MPRKFERNVSNVAINHLPIAQYENLGLQNENTGVIVRIAAIWRDDNFNQ